MIGLSLNSAVPFIEASWRCFKHANVRLVIERDPETGLYVGYVPGWPGAHTQGADSGELQNNLREVVELLLQDGDPNLEAEFVGVQTIQVA